MARRAPTHPTLMLDLVSAWISSARMAESTSSNVERMTFVCSLAKLDLCSSMPCLPPFDVSTSRARFDQGPFLTYALPVHFHYPSPASLAFSLTPDLHRHFLLTFVKSPDAQAGGLHAPIRLLSGLCTQWSCQYTRFSALSISRLAIFPSRNFKPL